MLTACSAPADCARIEAERATGIGLLVNGGSSRGNLLSGEAEEVILTVSRMEAEKRANPGYRAFFANGFNVTRALVLFGWEVILEWTASLRAIRRDVRPRGHRGGIYPFMRGAMCVIVRDLIVYGVLTDMMRGRPAVYATFSSYDEVAHHSGLERADTLEALRKLDEQFGRIDRARRYAPRPYEIVVLSDHGQTQGATFKQRNGYGLDELVERSLERGTVEKVAGGDEQHSMVGLAVGEATGRPDKQTGQAREERRLGPGRRRARLGKPRPHLVDGGAAPAHARGDRRAPSAADPGTPCPPARRLAPRPLVGARSGRTRLRRRPLPRRRNRRGRGSAGGVRTERASAPAAHRRVRSRGRHHGRQLLRPGPRGGLCLRGADLVPRWDRRAADAGVHPLSRRAPDSRRADRRCGGGPRRAVRLAPTAPGRRRRRPPSPLDEPHLAGDRHRRGNRSRRDGDAARAARRARGQPLRRRRPRLGSLRCAGDGVLGAARAHRLPRLRELRPVALGGGGRKRWCSSQQVETAQFLGAAGLRRAHRGAGVLRPLGRPRRMAADGVGHPGRRDQPVGSRAVPHPPDVRAARRRARKRPTESGSTRPPIAKRPGSTGSTGPSASSRPRCGWCCSSSPS